MRSAITQVESLDQEGRGIAHVDGKVIFIEGALPGEVVTYSSYHKKPSYEFAQTQKIIKASSARVTPRCPYFGVCGGCSMQHLDVKSQVAVKQRVLEDSLWHIGQIKPEQILPAIHGPAWEYRYRARFSVRYVPKKGGTLIGFREKRSNYVSDMKSCEVVPARISALLLPLRKLIDQLSIRQRLPQIELAIGEGVDVLVLRVMQPPSSEDEAGLKAFADTYHVQLFLQPQGPDSAKPFYPSHDDELYYTLPEFDLDIGFSPTEFTQVNPLINAVLVRRAMSLLQPQNGERIADMFCGLGNFSLAIARSGAQVLGIEGSRELVAHAQANACRNGLESSATFARADLFKIDAAQLAALGRFDRVLIDPPRDGAIELVKALDEDAPRRIVYVSCNPATLARDASVLVRAKGYRLSAAGVVNMFPHTSHVESIAVFDR